MTEQQDYEKIGSENLLHDLLNIDWIKPLPAYDAHYTATEFLNHLNNGSRIPAREICAWYYGFKDGENHSYEEVRDILKLGVTRERVCQMMTKCKHQLKPFVEECFIKEKTSSFNKPKDATGEYIDLGDWVIYPTDNNDCQNIGYDINIVSTIQYYLDADTTTQAKLWFGHTKCAEANKCYLVPTNLKEELVKARIERLSD